MNELTEREGMIADVVNRRIFGGRISINGGRITAIEETGKTYENFILPGFIDSHIHIESSMLVPYEFARIALVHGTVATISDPHEIANVCGIDGVLFMLENAMSAGLKFHFGAPSCVPATSFETAGATLDADAVGKLLKRDDIYYLSEMMNYPGVLHGDPEVMKKIALASSFNKPVDGHAPGLRGKEAEKYIKAGITTDHECFTADEARDKLKYGMKILIREGSAARNFDALIPLLDEHFENMMFCCDDKHPDELLSGHINDHVRRAIERGNDLMKVLQCACVNPVRHYKMKVGLLQPGDVADFIEVNNLKEFKVLRTVIDGRLYAENGNCFLPAKEIMPINNFNISGKTETDFHINAGGDTLNVIEALDGQLITKTFSAKCKSVNGYALADPQNDILKLAVVNRYSDQQPAIGFIKNLGIKNGAIASSVAHDSHNIIAAGSSDELLCRAVNLLIKSKGGLCAVSEKEEIVMPLPVAGLMSDADAVTTGKLYSRLDELAKRMGSELRAPYMTLSFMALLVIPQLKLSDKGLFDGAAFKFKNLFE